MKISLTLRLAALLLVSTFIANGQGPLIPYAGFNLGYANSSIDLDPDLPIKQEGLSSFAAGLQLEWFDNPIIGMSTDIDYFQGGTKTSNGDIKYNQICAAQQLVLMAPLVSKKWEAYINGGPQISYYLGNAGEIVLEESNYNDWTFGWRVGLGVNYVFTDFKLFISGEYLMDSGKRYEAIAPSVTMNSNTILVSLGYLYEFKPKRK